MIIHNAQPVPVRVANSRLPVYQVTYRDGLGDVVRDLFSRIAPKAIPIAKQLSMKAVDVVKDKAPAAIVNLAIKAFTAINDRIARLIRRPQKANIPPVALPSTESMPANVSKVINQAATEKLAELVTPEQINTSFISGDGLRFRRR